MSLTEIRLRRPAGRTKRWRSGVSCGTPKPRSPPPGRFRRPDGSAPIPSDLAEAASSGALPVEPGEQRRESRVRWFGWEAGIIGPQARTEVPANGRVEHGRRGRRSGVLRVPQPCRRPGRHWRHARSPILTVRSGGTGRTTVLAEDAGRRLTRPLLARGGGWIASFCQADMSEFARKKITGLIPWRKLRGSKGLDWRKSEPRRVSGLTDPLW